MTVPPIYAHGHGTDPTQEPHPYDSYMSVSKAVQGPFTITSAPFTISSTPPRTFSS